tara:strand:- start:947 stop:1054 length:108 start_codon:yes stop_codon:yes gene_type:complete
MAELIAVLLLVPPVAVLVCLFCWYFWIEIQKQREP